MNGLIERSELLELSMPVSEFVRQHLNTEHVVSVNQIRRAEVVDAEPVVRCKDCKHFMEFTETFREMIKFDGSCRLLVGFTEWDREMRKYTDYCSSGAKMDLEVEE